MVPAGPAGAASLRSMVSPQPLDLDTDVISLTAALCDIASVSLDEAAVAVRHRGRAGPAATT